jgi:uncharacterized protein
MVRKTGEDLPSALERKYVRLRASLEDMGRVLVAYSGGVDSTLLLKVAHDVLGRGAAAVTAASVIHPAWETREAKAIARGLGVPLTVLRVEPLEDPAFAGNPPERCYFCKQKIFSRFLEIARSRGIPWVADGTNAGDVGDFRPGLRALAELGVRSPLKEAGLTKNEIRRLSRSLGLPTADKPALACLASRFPYGTRLDKKGLRQVGRAEDILRRLGFGQVRVRHHGAVARLEVEPRHFDRLMKAAVRNEISRRFKKLGYAYVALDLEGYRTGSLNETLSTRRT